MGSNGLSRKIFSFIVILVSLSLGGCNWDKGVLFGEAGIQNIPGILLTKKFHSDEISPGKQGKVKFQVDDLFLEFYNSLGGEDILGHAISPLESSEGEIKQYLESGLLVFDPRAVGSQRFQLAPLGLELSIQSSEQVSSIDKTGRIINGKFVLSEFLEFYARLGGARFVGKPLTEARYNADKERIEQYFENLGFYKLDSESRVRLLPYGVYVCDSDCRDKVIYASIPAKQPILPEPFLRKILELGLEFVGKPLTGHHIAADGMQEVIFENLVLAANSESPEEVILRSLGEELGNIAEELASPEDSPLSEFIEIEDGKGFNVPIFFYNYLENHGGFQIAGQPISEVFSPEDGLYWQCFTKLCLQFDLNTVNEQRLSLVPLGNEYKAGEYDKIMDFTANQSLEKVEVKVWERSTFVSAEEGQEIHVALYENGRPLKNYEPIIIITMPDGSQREAYFQPSNNNGRTSLNLPPVEAPNGTLIAYQICLRDLDGESHCVGDNYLIWNSD